MKRVILLVTATATLVALALPVWAQSEENLGQRATLVLQGETGTQVSGSCTVGDEAPRQINGQLPQSFTYDLKGKPLKCEISSQDAVQVNFTVGNNVVRSVQRISGGTLNLAYNNGSISTTTVASSS